MAKRCMSLLLGAAFMCCSGAVHAVTVEQSSPCLLRGDLPAEPPGDCARAIAQADNSGKATLLFEYAYSLVEQERTIDALPILDRAVALAPDFVNARHERVYVLNDLGFCARALKDSDVEIRLLPDNGSSFLERQFTHVCLGQFDNALADVNREIALDGENADRIGARAKIHIWLGHYAEAEADLVKVEKLAAGNAEALENVRYWRDHMAIVRHEAADPARCELQNMTKETAPSRLIADCTAAYFAAKAPKDKAESLTSRSVAWMIIHQDRDRANEDLRVAVGINPDNPDTHINYGYGLLAVQHSWAARNEFNLALESNKRNPMALAGRAQANYNLGDKKTAFMDARASFESKPNPAALTLLGDLAKEQGDEKIARDFWLAAYQLGARDDGLIASLKSVGVNDPAKAAAENEKAP